MLFNINNYVRVKLTEHGRKINREHWIEIFNGNAHFKYIPPDEDSDGWSRWQMWELMQEFGPYIGNGMKPCFETTIEIVEPPQITIAA